MLLLDEPLSALDARVKVELRYALRRLVKDLGLTAIHVTHDQEEAMSVADRVIVMRKGEIVEVGEPTHLYDAPRNLFTANFVGESNFLEGTVHSVEDAKARIELRGEQILTVPRTTLRVGQPVVLAIRPEHLSLQPEDGDNCIQARVEESRFMGFYTRCRLRAETGDELLVDLPTSDARVREGTDSFVCFNPDFILLYPRPTEGLGEALKLE